MRFLIITAPTLKELVDELNAAILGSGRIVLWNTTPAGYEVLIDMYPTHVVTNDDILFADDPEIKESLVLAA